MLEVFYEDAFSRLPVFERKISLSASPALLVGPPRSGKTFLIYDLLSTLPKESYLYVDCNDLRLERQRLISEIVPFVKNRPISLVVLENYLPDIPLPPVSTILSSRHPLETKDFPVISLMPLDFEEYVAFWHKQSGERKALAISAIFSHYLKEGTLPEIVGKTDPLKTARLHEIIRQSTPAGAKQHIYFFLMRHAGFKLTGHQIYAAIKQTLPLSKDKLYTAIRELEEEKIILPVERYGQPHAARKFFPYDFALAGSTGFSKEILKSFETMIYLELYKKGADVTYTPGIDFFLPAANTAVLALPFATDEIVRYKISKLYIELRSFSVARVLIITMGLEMSFSFDAITCEALPFWVWAGGDE